LLRLIVNWLILLLIICVSLRSVFYWHVWGFHVWHCGNSNICLRLLVHIIALSWLFFFVYNWRWRGRNSFTIYCWKIGCNRLSGTLRKVIPRIKTIIKRRFLFYLSIVWRGRYLAFVTSILLFIIALISLFILFIVITLLCCFFNDSSRRRRNHFLLLSSRRKLVNLFSHWGLVIRLFTYIWMYLRIFFTWWRRWRNLFFSLDQRLLSSMLLIISKRMRCWWRRRRNICIFYLCILLLNIWFIRQTSRRWWNFFFVLNLRSIMNILWRLIIITIWLICLLITLLLFSCWRGSWNILLLILFFFIKNSFMLSTLFWLDLTGISSIKVRRIILISVFFSFLVSNLLLFSSCHHCNIYRFKYRTSSILL
jgi:hypothetical protein